jgi:hypothetical protein
VHWFSQKEDGNSFGIKSINMVPMCTYNSHYLKSTPNQKVEERIQSPGPKKIVACDGGGILGLMSVEIELTYRC